MCGATIPDAGLVGTGRDLAAACQIFSAKGFFGLSELTS